MAYDSDTTGSTVYGLVSGMNSQLGGVTIMNLSNAPDGIVTAPEPTASPSGTTVGFYSATNQLYQHTTGSTWQKLGSVA